MPLNLITMFISDYNLLIKTKNKKKLFWVLTVQGPVCVFVCVYAVDLPGLGRPVLPGTQQSISTAAAGSSSGAARSRRAVLGLGISSILGGLLLETDGAVVVALQFLSFPHRFDARSCFVLVLLKVLKVLSCCCFLCLF